MTVAISIVCRTPRCGNENVRIDMLTSEDASHVICGVCGLVITSDMASARAAAEVRPT